MSGWAIYYDDADPPAAYYYNSKTDESSWTPPPGFVDIGSSSSSLPTPTEVGDDSTTINDWKEIWSEEDGKYYYFSEKTNTSVWEKPVGFDSQQLTDRDGALDKTQGGDGDWSEILDEEYRKYYYNAVTGESSWDMPEGFGSATIASVSLVSNMRKSDSSSSGDGDGGGNVATSGGREGVRNRRVSFVVGSAELSSQNDAVDDDEGKALLHQQRLSVSGSEPDVDSLLDVFVKRERKPVRKSIFRAHNDDDDDDHLHASDLNTDGGKAGEINLAAFDPDSTLEEYSKLLAGITFEQYALLHVKDFRRKSKFYQAGDADVVSNAISYSGEEIKNPMIALSTPQQVSDAIKCSKKILNFMETNGDHARKTTKSPVEQAASIVEIMLKAPQESRDEVYLQICKQTRGRDIEDTKSVEMGWQLMLICLACFPPSRALVPHLMSECLANVLSHKPQTHGSSDDSFASDFEISRCAELALRACVMSHALPARVEMLSIEELEALRKGAKTDISVFTLDGKSVTIAADSWTSVKKLTTLVALELGVQTRNNGCFGLYESNGVGNGTGTERVLGDDERVLYLSGVWQHDAFSNAINANSDGGGQSRGRRSSTFRFLFQVQYFLDCTSKGSASIDSDAAAIRLFYIQACNDVLAARYPLTEQDAFLLAAVQCQEMLGDLAVPASSSPPSSASQGAATMDITAALRGKNLNAFLNRRFLGRYDGTHDQLQTRRRLVEASVLQAYSKLKGYSQAEARLAYLHIVRACKVYGSTYFKVQAPRSGGGGAMPTEVFLAVTPNAVIILQPETAFYLAEYGYESLERWHYKHHSVVLETYQGEKAFFKTEKALEVVGLIQTYIKLTK